MDNCTREIKNQFLFGFLECLIAWTVFDVIQFTFLLNGHNCEDIDQAFSLTSPRLKSNHTIAMAELHKQLGLFYSSQITVTAMASVANFSDPSHEKQLHSLSPCAIFSLQVFLFFLTSKWIFMR